ncbi:TetR family transcriptional regulator [Cellulomonas sp. Y8]|uniref:TetR/AcrR family transcriptional regulator n=1 Tax=Cellulomonas sp. Y8 TaxID=2591145 RepID=UPI003D73D344
MEFQRARTDEQRDERRRTILSTAAAMLTEMPVADLSLNELSKRVGLARSNVLRYFESREDILLELLARELGEAIAALDVPEGLGADAPLTARIGGVAEAVADALTTRPVLCDLISAQAAVLERNVSTQVALRHKRASRTSVSALVHVIQRQVPELTGPEAVEVIAMTILLLAGAWPGSRPTEALLAAYAEDPSVAQFTVDFREVVARTVEFSAVGLLARRGITGR